MSEVPIEVVAAVFHRFRDGQPEILFFRRATHVSGAGFWEFPGGKVEPGENHNQALHREIMEELDVEIHIGQLLGQNLHPFPNKTVRLSAYIAEIKKGAFQLKEHDGMRWLLEADVNQFRVSAADMPLLPSIYNFLRTLAK
jgi:8-oxo-dGTP diphosphatase